MRSIFGTAVDCEPVRVRRRRWHLLQPREVVMAPMGHIHFHPKARVYRDDFASGDLTAQGLFIHEMTHVWQAQRLGRYYLPLHRHPFCRYGYSLVPGRRLTEYGIEQQAEIVRHAFLLRNGEGVPGIADVEVYARLVDFPGAA